MNNKRKSKERKNCDKNLINYKDLERNVLSEVSKEIYDNKDKLKKS